MNKYVAQGLPLRISLKIAGLTKHKYYYRPSAAKRPGRKASTHTLRLVNDQWIEVPNDAVEEIMCEVNSNPDLTCGALRMQKYLQLQRFKINRKKIAPMMKRLGLGGKNIRKKDKSKKYVQYRMLGCPGPLANLQMDIKTHWLVYERRQAYTLTVIDTFTREVLGWYTGCTLRATDVRTLWLKIIENHLEPAGMAANDVSVMVISDNGPQFIADILKNFFYNNKIDHLFTHPYTPQENGHIESFHSIMSSAIERDHFNLSELIKRLEIFYNNYGYKRPHSSTCGLPPNIFRKAWENDLIISCYQHNKPPKFRLRIPLYEIPGILNQREHLVNKPRAKRDRLKKSGEDKSSAFNFRTPVNTSPSVASCPTKKEEKFALN